jgi:hypothetical protein
LTEPANRARATAVADVADTAGAVLSSSGLTRLFDTPRYAPAAPVCTTMSPP